MKRHRALVAAATLILLSPAAALAADSDPFKLSLDYDGTLLVKVLDIRIEQSVGGGRFQSSARMKSHGVLSLFKRLDVRAEAAGRLRNDRPAPAQFRHTNLDGAINRSVEVVWRPDDVATRAAPGYPSLGDPAPTKAQKLAAADPLTELLRIALSASDGRPCTTATTLFDGRQLYAVTFSAAAPRAVTPREASLGLEAGVRCRLTFSEVAGFDAKPAHKRNQGLKGPLSIDFARVGGDGPWVITGARGRTPLGDATIAVRALRFEAPASPKLIALN